MAVDINIGERIETERRKKNVSQSKLADSIGRTMQTVYTWEKGITSPKFSDLCEIADFLKMPLEILIFGGENNGET